VQNHSSSDRAANQQIAQKLLTQLKWWEDHVKLFNASIDNNPTFGNKQGGLTTIYEKSLGAVAKGGQSPLMAVYDYAQRIDTPGFGSLDTPGYDPVQHDSLVCGAAPSAAHHRRGSVYGCKTPPASKIATNTPMFERMRDDMDLTPAPSSTRRILQQVGHTISKKSSRRLRRKNQKRIRRNRRRRVRPVDAGTDVLIVRKPVPSRIPGSASASRERHTTVWTKPGILAQICGRTQKTSQCRYTPYALSQTKGQNLPQSGEYLRE